MNRLTDVILILLVAIANAIADINHALWVVWTRLDTEIRARIETRDDIVIEQDGEKMIILSIEEHVRREEEREWQEHLYKQALAWLGGLHAQIEEEERLGRDRREYYGRMIDIQSEDESYHF